MTEVKICKTLEQAHTLASRISKAIERLVPYTTARTRDNRFTLSMPLHGVQEIAIARIFAQGRIDADLAYRVVIDEKESLVYAQEIDIENTCNVVTCDENNILHFYQVSFDGYLTIGRYLMMPDLSTKNIKIL